MDVAIVGGGPAGSVLAIELGRRGVRVLLLEKSRHPRRKACGEGLLPRGVQCLRELGLLGEALALGFPRVRGFRIVAPSGRYVHGDFPEGFGLVVRRDRFDEWLFRVAGRTPNVEAREDVRVTDPSQVRARIVVGADGLRSIFHRRFVLRRSDRIGQSVHVRLEVDDRVEIRFQRDGEMFIAPCGYGEALVATLGTSFIPIQHRLNGLELTTPILARAPLGLSLPRVVDGNLLLVGDAAGAPDPITGDGLSLALCSARLAARVIAEGRPLSEYEGPRLEMGRNADRFGRLLRRLSARPGVANRVIDGLARRPDILERVMEVAVGSRPARDLGLLDMAKLVLA